MPQVNEMSWLKVYIFSLSLWVILTVNFCYLFMSFMSNSKNISKAYFMILN